MQPGSAGAMYVCVCTFVSDYRETITSATLGLQLMHVTVSSCVKMCMFGIKNV
jgi:hypothetical protein